MREFVRTSILVGAVVLQSCSSNVKPATPATGAGAGAPPSSGSGSWSTYYHDNGRSGVASDGPPAPAAVHRQWVSPALDGEIYAQPLVVGDRVVVATENDTVYALNAATGTVVWARHLGTPVPSSSLPCGNVNPVGITSTPVIDVGTSRVYTAAMVSPARHTLFALDLANGSVVASAAVDAPGADPKTHNQRGALALANGNVLVPFGGRYGDCGIYHGQLAAVPAITTGLGAPSWYTVPSGREGGLWAPPGPVIAGDGTIYLATGNTASSGRYDYANSVVHLSPSLQLVDFFAPQDWAALSSTDSDLGSTNPVLVGSRVFQVGKSGVGYLLDAGHLGGIGGQLSAATVCRGEAIGGVSRNGTDLFVPCPGGLAAVSVAGDRVVVRWMSGVAAPGPAVVTPGAVWTVATGSGELIAFDVTSGKKIFSRSIGGVPSRFTSPAAALGRVVVAAGRKVMAFSD